MSDDNGLELLTTQKNEYVKQYIELDGQDRIYKVYTAGINTPVNGHCEVTVYGYANLTTTTITARKEGRGVWTQVFEDTINAL